MKKKYSDNTKPNKPVAVKAQLGSGYIPNLKKYFNDHGLLILLFLLTVVSFFVFRDFIFLNKIYLFKDIGSDSINATYPHQYQVAYYMQHESFFPKWSFYQGMGQNIFPFSIPDPFNLILVLLGPDNLAYGIGYMEITKIFCAGIFFYLFLKKLTHSGYTAVFGSLLYSYSGYIILGSCWTIFSTEAVYVALLLYAFELLFQDKKVFLFPVAVCLFAINQPFDFFLTGLFLLAYMIFRYLNEFSFDLKKFFLFVLKLAGLGALGVLMSMFFLVPDIIQMLESPRVGGESSYFSKLMSRPIFGFEGKLHNVTALMRFFSNDMMGTGSDYHGWYNYLEAPLFYCGLINSLLIPQLFRFLNKKKKLIFAIFISIFIIPVIFPYFRYMFWGFTGDYYRIFSLFVGIIFLLYSTILLKHLEENLKINLPVLGISLIGILIILFLKYYPEQDVINEDLRNKATVFLIAYAIILSLININSIRNIIKLTLLLLISVELINFSDITVNDRPVISGDELKQKVGFNDYSSDAVAFLKGYDKNFFRVTKDYYSGPAIHNSINDAQVQKFYGSPSYNSFNQINYIKFLDAVGVISDTNEIQTRWAPGLMETPFLHPFGSIKYGLSKTSNSFLRNFNYDSLTTVGDVHVYKNRVSLPLGFSYSKIISLKDFKQLSINQKRYTLYKALVVDDSLYPGYTSLSRFRIGDTSLNYTWGELASDAAILKKDSLKIEQFGQNGISGKIHSEQPAILFFSIPFDKGWSARVDGKEVKPMIVNIGFTGLFLDKGDHQVELSFTPRFYYLSALFSAIGLVLFVALIAGKYIFERRRKKIIE